MEKEKHVNKDNCILLTSPTPRTSPTPTPTPTPSLTPRPSPTPTCSEMFCKFIV